MVWVEFCSLLLLFWKKRVPEAFNNLDYSCLSMNQNENAPRYMWFFFGSCWSWGKHYMVSLCSHRSKILSGFSRANSVVLFFPSVSGLIGMFKSMIWDRSLQGKLCNLVLKWVHTEFLSSCPRVKTIEIEAKKERQKSENRQALLF